MRLSPERIANANCPLFNVRQRVTLPGEAAIGFPELVFEELGFAELGFAEVVFDELGFAELGGFSAGVSSHTESSYSLPESSSVG